ncbi:hypothetical protein CDL12_18656 [Handroanthus impetiginosus]|uniref:DUF538 domain-containing protein n=1 Tax=Handroanthus impetiginosus TaxID=429701 RepID=A0A2G9GTZ7_9LAMI|nr:hypothetical protein CDL12_18656 [Handroanthus impetiginosus]
MHKATPSTPKLFGTAMSSTTRLLFILALAVLAVLPAATGDKPTVYEVLQSYDFPVGLLPQGVTDYELNRSTGAFTVYLNKTCSFTINGYNLRYKTKVTGTISTDKINNLKGIQVKVLLFWVNIIEVTRDDDEIDFSVGIASASFAVDIFYESPQCGCGFDCVNAGKKKEKFSFAKRILPLVEQV